MDQPARRVAYGSLNSECRCLKLVDTFRLQVDANPARHFLREFYEQSKDESDRIPKAELYNAYRTYCKDFVCEPIDSSRFAKQVLTTFSRTTDQRPTLNGTRTYSYGSLRRKQVELDDDDF